MKEITPFSKSRILNAISFYKYLFSFLMALCFFVLPLVKPRSYFADSQFIDFLVRCVLWLYLVSGYWSLSANLTNQINKTVDIYQARKKLPTFISVMISAIMLGAMMGFLTRWSLLSFVPWLLNGAINIIATLNGLIYSIGVSSQYFTLPRDE